jgi:hypothetical protein
MPIVDLDSLSLHQDIQGQIHLQHLLELPDDFLYKCHSHASSSFSITYFMNDKPTVVNHDLILYRMPFLLARIVCLFSFVIFRSWNLLFCTIYKRKKAWEILFNFFWSSQPLFVMLYIFCGIGK